MKIINNKEFKYFQLKTFFIKTFLFFIKKQDYNFINLNLIIINLKIIFK